MSPKSAGLPENEGSLPEQASSQGLFLIFRASSFQMADSLLRKDNCNVSRAFCSYPQGDLVTRWKVYCLSEWR